MEIALIGYGKMGKIIERLALEKGHEVVLKINRANRRELTTENLRKADVAIEFSTPDSAFSNIEACLRAGIPVVSGTTAWLDRLPEAKALCSACDGAFLYASNFSIGVNIFFAVNEFLAKMMAPYPTYNVRMEEIHHTQKLDAPSGTAITLAEGILKHLDRKKQWRNAPETSPDELSVISKRIDEVPGTHEVVYESEVDTILIKHVAHSREGFAAGALLAAEWIIGRKGFFEMKDLFSASAGSEK
ncbi:MAG: 4-hydroxy-tetrahydrodipicolinate reductase [Bacteroidetes bacterium]|nr:MAG: 4-hydroxy-tetrahydrodipicolinate reductase [Bacteroidota bacterium]